MGDDFREWVECHSIRRNRKVYENHSITAIVSSMAWAEKTGQVNFLDGRMPTAESQFFNRVDLKGAFDERWSAIRKTGKMLES